MYIYIYLYKIKSELRMNNIAVICSLTSTILCESRSSLLRLMSSCNRTLSLLTAFDRIYTLSS